MTNGHERRLRCLVVGREKAVAEVVGWGVAATLESMGHSVGHVWSGKEGISRVKADHFDLVLLDGQERLKNARAIKLANPHARVILMTANPMLEEAEGVDAVLVKPFGEDELKKALVG